MPGEHILMRLPKYNLFAWFITAFGLLSISPIVHANLSDDAIGSYVGNISVTESGACALFTETASLILTITKVSTNNFHGDGIITFSDGDIDDLGIDLVGITASTFSFTWDTFGINNPFIANGSGSGSITSSSITISGTGIETAGPAPLCNIAFSGTLTKTSADVLVDPELTPSSTITEAVLFSTQIQGTISDIASHIAGALSGLSFSGGPRVTNNQFKMEGATGLNAGDGTTVPYGVWGNYSYTDYENDLSSIAFDGSSHSFLGGIDFGFWENTVLGLAFGYDIGDIDTTFNQGHQDTDSYTIVPYFGGLLSDMWSVDFSIGYSNVDYDQFRTLPGTTTRITSTPDSDRWFGALNLNGVTYYNNWIIGGRLGTLWAKSELGSYTESNGVAVAKSKSKVGTWSIAGDVAYSFQNYEPFLNLSYQRDYALTEISVTSGPQPSNDRDDILMSAGVRYFSKGGISGNLEYSKRFLRDDFDEDRVSLTIRVDF